MKYKEQIQEEWLQINIKLNNLLAELEKLDKEREQIAHTDFKSDKQLSEAMSQSVKQYEELLNKMKELNKQSSAFKKQIKDN